MPKNFKVQQPFTGFSGHSTQSCKCTDSWVFTPIQSFLSPEDYSSIPILWRTWMCKHIERCFVCRWDIDTTDKCYYTQRNLPFMISKGDRKAVASWNLAFNDVRGRLIGFKAGNLKLSFIGKAHLLLQSCWSGSPVSGNIWLCFINILQIRE